MKKHPTFLMLITFFALALFCPASSKADTMAHAIWGVGVQIGWAEMGAYQGAAPSTLVQSLVWARDMARQTGCIPPDDIERLRLAMSQTRDSRTLYQSISSYRQSAHTYAQRCRCAGGGNAGWALYGLGVQIGWAEMASYYGVDSRTVLQALTSARDHARQISTCINTRNIDYLINAMSQARNSRMLYQQITSYRQGTLLAEVQRNCSCGGGSSSKGCVGFVGRWNTNYGPYVLHPGGTGSYFYRGHHNPVTWRASGNVLEGTWRHAFDNLRGTIRSTLSADGNSFRGHWFHSNGRRGGSWNGTCQGGNR